ncbi:MAG: hypothetical protein JXB23_08045 [Candidatus Aminicenantes bacterium]|nr:hypothetical protein [Candidatus Aminicenantes bacterium]
MKVITKIGILFLALVISVAGFNWITCCSGCIDIARFCQNTNQTMLADTRLNYEIIVTPQ